VCLDLQKEDLCYGLLPHLVMHAVRQKKRRRSADLRLVNYLKRLRDVVGRHFYYYYSLLEVENQCAFIFTRNVL
jgi:hypothetical protein